jgi:nucleotide-binding universal stress UspA family protein
MRAPAGAAAAPPAGRIPVPSGAHPYREVPVSERILVCTRGDGGADGALRLAARLVERDGCAVEVLTVMEPVYLESMTLYSLAGEVIATEARVAEGYRSHVREQLREIGGPLATVEPRVQVGHAAHTIASVAAEGGHGLILVGSSPHRRVERWLGSETALHVARLARVPVLGVPTATSRIPRSAVAAMDFSPYGDDAAAVAARLLGPGGRLTLVHATWSRADPASPPSEWESTYRVGALQRLAGIGTSLGRDWGVETETAVEDDAPAEAVLRAASTAGAEMVAAGSHGHGFFTRLVMGSVSTRLFREFQGIVLVAPPRVTSPELSLAEGGRVRLDRTHREVAGPPG